MTAELAHALEIDPELDQHPGAAAARTLPDEPQQEMLGAQVVVAQVEGFAQR